MSAAADQVTLTEAELRDLGTRSFQGLGLTLKDAQDACAILLLADLFGLSTHGFSRMESYGERLQIKGIQARPNIRVEQVAAAMVKVDGDNAVGPLVGMRALEAATVVARKCGVGVALARGSNHFGPVSPYSYIAAQAGFASIIGSNSSTSITPWGGTDARLGNSPVGFAVPNPGGAHFMLDMAISVAARAKIRNALKRGQSIPDTWATDKHGRATTDPAQALDGFLLPIGGHKGYGLALLVDLFAGVLSGAAYLTHVTSWIDEPELPQNLGHFFILLDTSVLGSTQWLAERMCDFAAILHGSPPADSSKPVLVPGEIEFAKMAHQRQHGIKIDLELHARLQRYAGRVKPDAQGPTNG